MNSTSQTFGVSRRIHLVADRSPGGMRLSLLDERGDLFLIEFSPRPPVELRVRRLGGQPAHEIDERMHRWPMTRGPMRHAWSRDPFLMATSWAYSAMYRKTDNERLDPNAGGTMRHIYTALAALAREAADSCDRSARAIAMRFPIHIRFWLYARLVSDPTGRLAQLATVCPGALIIAFALTAGTMEQGVAGRRLLDHVIEGHRLDRALAEPIEVWAASAPERAFVDREHIDPVWDRVVRTAGAERAELLAHQQLLVRRAGPMVATTNLFLPPPIAFVPEDIPRKTRDNARWFSLVKCTRLLLASPIEEHRQRLEGLSAFVSRHAPALARAPWATSPRMLVGSLRDYAVATSRWPTRGTSLRYLDDVARWHERMALIRGVADLRGLVSGDEVDPESPFPEPPKGEWHDDAGSDLAPLTSVGALVSEGNTMRHCVASRYPFVARGVSAIYHATVHGEPLTVEIQRKHLGWRIEEAKGFANREPTPAEWSVLRCWEAGLG